MASTGAWIAAQSSPTDAARQNGHAAGGAASRAPLRVASSAEATPRASWARSAPGRRQRVLATISTAVDALADVERPADEVTSRL